MVVTTIHLPEDKHNRLKAIADQRSISLNQLLEEFATIAITEQEGYARFQMRAKRGNINDAIQILDTLDNIERPTQV
jgi:predicted DNA-binding ribbon-helix-helix protein